MHSSSVLLMYLFKKLWIEIISYFNRLMLNIKGHLFNFFASENNVRTKWILHTKPQTWTEFLNSGVFPITRVGLFNLFIRVDTQYLEKNWPYQLANKWEIILLLLRKLAAVKLYFGQNLMQKFCIDFFHNFDSTIASFLKRSNIHSHLFASW